MSDTNEQDKLAKYQREILHVHRADIANIPVKYRGTVISTIQYKHLRKEMIGLLGTLIDSVVIQLSKPLQRLTDALIDFSDAYGNNLGIYNTLYGMCGDLMQMVLAQRDVKAADALMDAVVNAVSGGKDMSKCATELKEALKQLERSIIAISASTKTEQLELDVEKSYTKARKYMMEAEDLRRDLAIEKSTLQQLQDTSKTDQEVQTNLQQRIAKELEAAQNQQQALHKAIQEDGKVTTTTHTRHNPYYGWRWWYYGGSYSYTTSSKKDTSMEQSTAKANISSIDERVANLRERMETGSLNRNKRLETTKANMERLTNEMQMAEQRRDKEIAVAKGLEEMLTQARLEAAGCNQETSRKLAEAFKLTLPLFVELADNTAQVSVTFNTAKAVIQATHKMPVTTAISVFDSVTKLAIAGDFVVNGSFGIGNEMNFRNQMNTLTMVTNQSAQAYQALPAPEKDNNKLNEIMDAMPASRSSVQQAAVVCAAINPEDLF